MTDNVEHLILEQFRRLNGRLDKIEFRLDKHANMQFPIGKASFTADQLNDNFAAVMDEINRMKPSAAKGRYIKKATLSSTMGPGIPIDPAKSEDDDF